MKILRDFKQETNYILTKKWNLNLDNCQIQVNGKTSKIYELFGVKYSILKNKFYCKDKNKEMEKVDVFSKKIAYEDNTINPF